jgi:hypothetical protein
MGMSVTLDYSSGATRSIADTYSRGEIPLQLTGFKNNQVYCPKTGRHYKQTDYRQIFLIPVRD